MGIEIRDSYTCRPNKGTHGGADRAQQFLRKVKRKHGQVYALKADIAKFFQNVDHASTYRLRKHIMGSVSFTKGGLTNA